MSVSSLGYAVHCYITYATNGSARLRSLLYDYQVCSITVYAYSLFVPYQKGLFFCSLFRVRYAQPAVARLARLAAQGSGPGDGGGAAQRHGLCLRVIAGSAGRVQLPTVGESG
jgi:hypothetical protein